MTDKTGAEILKEIRDAEAERRKGRKEKISAPIGQRLVACHICKEPFGTTGQAITRDGWKVHPPGKCPPPRPSKADGEVIDDHAYKRFSHGHEGL